MYIETIIKIVFLLDGSIWLDKVRCFLSVYWFDKTALNNDIGSALALYHHWQIQPSPMIRGHQNSLLASDPDNCPLAVDLQTLPWHDFILANNTQKKFHVMTLLW